MTLMEVIFILLSHPEARRFYHTQEGALPKQDQSCSPLAHQRRKSFATISEAMHRQMAQRSSGTGYNENYVKVVEDLMNLPALS